MKLRPGVAFGTLPWWAVWLVAPRSRLAARLAGHAAVFIALGLVYTGLIGAGALSSGGGGGFDFDSLQAAFSEPMVFLAGWTHYLAFDLFVGAWIVRESGRLSVEPRLYLFFTLILGPLGLMSFLVRRTFRLRSLGQLGQTDLV